MIQPAETDRSSPTDALLSALATALGPKGFTRDAEAMAPWLTDWRGTVHGAAAAMLSPASTAEVQAIVRVCHEYAIPFVARGAGRERAAHSSHPEPLRNNSRFRTRTE